MTAQKPTLLSVFPAFEVGGAQARFATVANHFGGRIRHVIFAMNGVYDCMSRLDKDLDVTVLDCARREGSTFANREPFRRALRALKPDRLLTHNWGTIDWSLANWPRVAPHIHIEDGFGPDEADRQLPRRIWTRRVLLRNHTVVVPSRTLERMALDRWKLPRSAVKYVPNGIDIGRFIGTSIPPLDAKPGPLTLGTVAVLRGEKNLRRLLDAFRIFRDEMPARLVLAGDGPERAALEARMHSLGLSSDVVFTGFRTDTERVYADLDIFVLSSDTEQMPTSVIEAMAAGLPIVSTDVGDVSNMVSPENRPFIVAKDASALAKAIATLAGYPDLRAQIGAANRRMAQERYADTEMFAAYGALFGVEPFSGSRR